MLRNFFLTPQGTIRLRIRIAFSFAVIGSVVAGIVTLGLLLATRAQILTQIQQRALTAARLTALQQNGDLHSTLREPEDADSVNYLAIKNRLGQIARSDPDITSIYTMRMDENNNIYFVVDYVRPDLAEIRSPAKLGEFYIDASAFLVANMRNMREPMVESEVYTDSWGTVLSAYAPFYRSDGSLEGVIGLDISANAITEAENNLRNVSLWMLAGIIPAMIAIGLVLGSIQARPIEQMSEGIERIIAGDFSQEIEYGARDEIGQLTANFNNMSSQLRGLISDLEGRVAERTIALTQRTQELETLAEQGERRASQLQAIAQVSTIINTVQDTAELLPRITQVISDQFGYYHVGIFLLSSDGRYAVLSATNSEGGQKMLARNHRLQVGGAGIVGYVTSTGVPRIALDVGDDAYFFDNPDLPETRSEMAVPLRIGKRIIGALDVQSKKAAAFTEMDAELLAVLADQVTVALENARTFEETRKSLAEAQNIYRQYLRSQWADFAQEEHTFGYRYSMTRTQPIERAPEGLEVIEAIRTGERKIVHDETTRMAVPIKLRGEVIGVLNLKAPANREWSDDELDIINAVAERVAIATENARLVTETQRKAAKEEAIEQITSKISASVNMRNILQTTVEELGRALPGSEILIQFRGQDEQA
jgi:GAF domain-containing protein/HAMP domain-containing protein